MPSPTTITIQGFEFLCTLPYEAGHICTLSEASVLNATRCDNLRNNFAPVVKAEVTRVMAEHSRQLNATEILELKHKFKDYDSQYQFKMVHRESADPVGRMAHRIALDLGLEYLRKIGKTKAEVEDFDERVAKIAAKDSVLNEARRRVAAAQSIAIDTFGSEGEV